MSLSLSNSHSLSLSIYIYIYIHIYTRWRQPYQGLHGVRRFACFSRFEFMFINLFLRMLMLNSSWTMAPALRAHISIYTSIYLCVCMYTYIYIYTYIHTYTYMIVIRISIFIIMCISVYIRMYIYIYICIYIYIERERITHVHTCRPCARWSSHTSRRTCRRPSFVVALFVCVYVVNCRCIALFRVFIYGCLLCCLFVYMFVMYCYVISK